MNQFSVMNLRENQFLAGASMGIVVGGDDLAEVVVIGHRHTVDAVLNFQELTTGEWIRLLKLLYFGLDVGLNLNKILEIPEIYTYSFTGFSNSFRKKYKSRYG